LWYAKNRKNKFVLIRLNYKNIMKKSIIALVLLGMLLIVSQALAQEQIYAYSGFARFVDNVKFFFSTGENKIKLALEIREKEVYSALDKKDSSSEELERARKKLLVIQENVSANVADEVKSNSNKLTNDINERKNLSEDFKTYILEEKKTQLTAELVIETDGKEGQTLKREVVKDETTGQKRVKIVVNLDNGGQKIVELEGEMARVENEIAERIIVKTQGEGNGGLNSDGKVEVKGGNNGNSGVEKARVEVKTYTPGDGTLKNDPLPKPDLNKINPDLYDPDAKVPGDTIDETYDDEEVNSEPAGEGANVLAP
jgi:hypothetical protein